MTLKRIIQFSIIICSIQLFAITNSTSYSADFIISSYRAHNFALYTYDLKTRKILFNEINNISKGGIIILNFTSYTCKPCKKEIPELQQIALKHGKDKIKLWIVYTDSDRKKIGQSIKDINIKSTVLLDTLGSVALQYGVKKIPTTIIITKTRQIKITMVGYSKDNIRKLKNFITSLK